MKSHPRPRITTIAYHVAFWPVVLGILIVLIWYFQRFYWLPLAGVLLLYIAVPINLVFVGVLIVKRIKNSRLSPVDQVSPRNFSAPLLALLMNYLVGFLCLVAASYIGNRADILIINNSSFRLEAIQAQDPSGTRTGFPDIEPNDKASISIYPRGEGEVTVSLTANDKEIVATPIGYWIWGSENRPTLIINKDLSHNVGPEGEPQVLDSSFSKESKK